MRKYTYEEVKSFVDNKNGLLLSKEYKNCKTKLDIRCLVCANQWKVSFDKIKNCKTWCPTCAGNVKHTIEFVRSKIEDLGGRLHTKKYINNYQKLNITCDKNHKIKTTFDSIMSGSWCIRCGYDKARKKLALDESFVRDIIENRAGQLLNAYINAKSNLNIKCLNCKYIWSNSFNNIYYSNQWCPKCCLGKTQKKITNILEETFRGKVVKANYKGFNWLKTKNKRMEIDIWIPSKKLAIEYDGEQHFQPIRFGGISKREAEKRLDDIKKRDKLKNKLIKQHPEDVRYFIRFNYKQEITKDLIVDKLKTIGVKIDE